jgi:hypothetical protein
VGVLDAAFELALVSGAVKVAPRFRDERVDTDLPHLESADTNPLAGPARPRVGTHECPPLHGAVPLNEEAIHEHLHIGEGGHESLRHLGDGTEPHGRSAAIDAERAVR